MDLNQNENNQQGYQQGYQPGYQQGYQPGYPPGYQQGYQPGYQPGYQQGNQPGFQPGGYVAKPSSYLALAILTTIFCCIPFGIVGIVYASKVDGLYAAGNYNAAKEASDNAKKWSFIAIGCCIIVAVVYFVFIIAMVCAGY